MDKQAKVPFNSGSIETSNTVGQINQVRTYGSQPGTVQHVGNKALVNNQMILPQDIINYQSSIQGKQNQNLNSMSG